MADEAASDEALERCCGGASEQNRQDHLGASGPGRTYQAAWLATVKSSVEVSSTLASLNSCGGAQFRI